MWAPRRTSRAFPSPARPRDPHWPTFERQRLGECVEHTRFYCATSFLARVLSERASVAQGIGPLRSTPVLYRGILQPLSEDGGCVDGVCSASPPSATSPQPPSSESGCRM